MEYLVNLCILSVIEGVTEFLPISSTGHLILAQHVLNFNQNEFIKTYIITIQLGAIIAVLYFYRNVLLRNYQLWLKLFVAFLPSLFIGYPLYKFIKGQLFECQFTVVSALFVGGVILLIMDRIHNANNQKTETITYKMALLIGLFQTISIIPGISRSAATIIGALLIGLNKKKAIEFSFLLAIPTIFAATVLDLINNAPSLTNFNVLTLIMGCTISFIVALGTIKWFLSYVQKLKWSFFGWYRIILSIAYYLLIIKK